MKKSLSLASLIFLFITCFTGTVFAADYVLKFATVVPPKHPSALEMFKFADIVAKKSNGKIAVQVFPAGQLGGEKELVEGVSMGTIDMFECSPGSVSTQIPAFGVLDCPYLFKDLAHLQRVVRGPIGQKLAEKARKIKGIKVLALDWYFGVRQLTTKDTKVEKPEDMNGLLIRVQPDKLYLEMIKAMGGTPTPVAFPELYMALKQGTVQGQENPVAIIQFAKFYEAQKYLNLTSHMIRMMCVGINEKTFNKLPADLQKVVQESIKEAGEYGDATILESEKEITKDLQKKGMVVVKPDLSLFREACSGIPAMFEKEWGKDMIEAIKQTK